LRKAANVSYPNAYASANEAATSQEKYRFNCAQKAHANFTENHPTFLVALLVTGLRFPLVAASLGAVWNAGRIAYALGYTRKENAENGKGRLIGVWYALAHYPLMLMAAYTSFKLIMG
jgi:glutathione S-transferase